MKDLLIRIADITEAGVSVEGEASPGAFPILADLINTEAYEFTSPVKLSAKIRATGHMYRASGSFDTHVRLICSRCLSGFEKPLKDAFEMTFIHSVSETADINTAPERELTVEEMGIMVIDEEVINLKDAVQQQLIMSLSQRPLCSEACKGLCQNCGANLNEEDCRCRKAPINSKFEVLKDLKFDE